MKKLISLGIKTILIYKILLFMYIYSENELVEILTTCLREERVPGEVLTNRQVRNSKTANGKYIRSSY